MDMQIHHTEDWALPHAGLSTPPASQPTLGTVQGTSRGKLQLRDPQRRRWPRAESQDRKAGPGGAGAWTAAIPSWPLCWPSEWLERGQGSAVPDQFTFQPLLSEYEVWELETTETGQG